MTNVPQNAVKVLQKLFGESFYIFLHKAQVLFCTSTVKCCQVAATQPATITINAPLMAVCPNILDLKGLKINIHFWTDYLFKTVRHQGTSRCYYSIV